MHKKIKRGKVGRPPSRHHKKQSKPRKQKPPVSLPDSPAELTVEQEAMVEEFAKRVLKVRQIRARKDLFEQMNQIRKYLSDSCAYGELTEVGTVVQWHDVWKKMVERVL